MLNFLGLGGSELLILILVLIALPIINSVVFYRLGRKAGQNQKKTSALKTILTDGSGNQYIEIIMPNTETVRVSEINDGWIGGRCYRVNLVDKNNHVRPGAEFPEENIREVINALRQLGKV